MWWTSVLLNYHVYRRKNAWSFSMISVSPELIIILNIQFNFQVGNTPKVVYDNTSSYIFNFFDLSVSTF